MWNKNQKMKMTGEPEIVKTDSLKKEKENAEL